MSILILNLSDQLMFTHAQSPNTVKARR